MAKIEVIDINELHLNPDNPRIIRDEKYKKLVQSIKDFPEMLQLRPIIIDKKNMILGGNIRYQACIELKIEKVPVIVADKFTKKQLKEFIIKDNLQVGEWNIDQLLENWDNELLALWGFDIDKYVLDVPEFKEQTIERENNNDDDTKISKQSKCPNCGYEW